MVQFPKGSPSQLPELLAVPADKAKLSLAIDDETIGQVGSKRVPFDSLERFLDLRNIGPSGINTGIEIENVAALGAFSVSGFNHGDVVSIRGHTAPGDGGEGSFRLSLGVAMTADGGTIIAANGPANSFWVRMYLGNVITPHMFGFVDDFDGTTGTDNSTAVQNAAGAADALNSSNIVRPVLLFPRTFGYFCTSTITIKEHIHVFMDAPIVHDLSESSIGLIVGTTAINNRNVRLKLRVTRKSGDTSDWTNEGSIGIKLFNLRTSDALVDVGELNGGFTIGLQCMASGAGFAYNNIRLGMLRNHKFAIDVTNETSGGAGFPNENTFLGGNFVVDTGLRSGIIRHGVRLKSADGTETAINANVFQKPSIECQSECVPFLIVNGQQNEVRDARDETNGPVFANILHNNTRKNFGNKFNLAFGTGTLNQQGNAHDNVISYRAEASAYSPMRLVFDSGNMHDNAVAYDGTFTFIPGVHVGVSSQAKGLKALSTILFYVSETFTTDFASDNDKLLDTAHTLNNGDRVYLTHSVDPHDLPNGLETDSGAIKQLYYVVEKGTNDFKLSLTLNGTAVTFSDDGTGTHTYNSRSRYVEFTTARNVGTRVDTTVAKNFVLERDTVVGNEGRAMIHCFDADDVLLKNEETFTVDIATDELIQANHTLIVDDRITLTGAALPAPLATGTDYWIESFTAGRFKISATEGGVAIDITTTGTPPHTYHLSYQYATSASLSWNTTFGGYYQQGTDQGADFPFKIRDEVKSINMSLGGGTAVLRIRRFKLHTTDIAASPRTWLDYDADRIKEYAIQAPTVGVYHGIGKTVWNYEPVPGEPVAWVLAVAGSPGTWDELSRSVQQPETATGTLDLQSGGATSIDSSGGAVDADLGSGDYIGQIKTIVMTDASNSSTVEIALHETSDPEIATFDAVNETGVFMWTGAEWVTIFATCTFV